VDGSVYLAGVVEYVFEEDAVSHRLVRPDGVAEAFIGPLMGQYGSLRFAPAGPTLP
jgi:hypothetical protein